MLVESGVISRIWTVWILHIKGCRSKTFSPDRLFRLVCARFLLLRHSLTTGEGEPCTTLGAGQCPKPCMVQGVGVDGQLVFPLTSILSLRGERGHWMTFFSGEF